MISVKILLLLAASSCSHVDNYKLEAPEFKQKLEATPGALVIDVRRQEEYACGHLKNAVNINWLDDKFFDSVSTLNKERPVFVYCLAGGRADLATENMINMGFKTVYELKGGILKWRKQGYPEELPDVRTGMSSRYFDSVVAANKSVLVIFTARWCRPCHAMRPALEEVEKQRAGTVVLRIDADTDQAILKGMGVDKLPTLKIYRQGKLAWEHAGVVPDEELLKHLQ